MINTDELKLKQILVNLLDNALKFTDKGSIKFGYTMPENGYITFFVSDTGLGIEPEYQQVIFERFRQAEISDRNKYKGTGLGLAICKGNAELLNGSLWMESIPGKGSTFYCRLPYNPVTISASATPKQSILYRFDWKEKLVVIVEDDEQNTRYLQTVLRKTGVKIKYARDGVAFREILSYQPSIDVILMDIQLPGEDGWQLTKYSKSVNSQIPIIAQTAFGLESDRKKSMDAGCDSFIAKPITPDELLSTLALYLGN
jgi:CheY-like chemotaxis protein